MIKKPSVKDKLSLRVAKARRTIRSKPLLRVLGGRGAVTLLVGAALSIGGLSETMDHVHFLVEKDLDAVRVVKQVGRQEKVVAKLDGDFSGNTVYKLSQLLPDRYVTRQLALFDDRWIPDLPAAGAAPQEHRNVFVEEMAKINDAIHREFFSSAMPYGDLIHAKALKYDVDPLLVAAVIEQESKFSHTARSQVGARGLMQLMPRTGRWLGASNLYDPEQNVDAGVRYIKYLQERFNGNLKETIAAYNAGEGNVRRYNGVPPFRETKQYVRKVLHNYAKRNREMKAFEAEQRQQSGGAAIAEPAGVLTIR
ncbi:MAG TPA: lytic transglycosylase domain-containing protein [Thermoanaerobaculia bacterium]|nr:lytic transglycosylase domain-containing protein [Thermoanaerobaculia bacterium]